MDLVVKILSEKNSDENSVFNKACGLMLEVLLDKEESYDDT